jgi:putative ABC transport system permease protein
MGSVKERTKEIGIFRAIGFRQQHIVRILFYETGIVSLISGIIGYGLGMLAIWTGLRLLTDHTGATFVFNPLLAASAVTLAVVVGLAASAYPACVAARLDPNQALRSL